MQLRLLLLEAAITVAIGGTPSVYQSRSVHKMTDGLAGHLETQ